jgi:hypothetical protein
MSIRFPRAGKRSLTLLHEVIARNVAQHAVKVLLLLGTTIFALALTSARSASTGGRGA